MPYRSAKHTLSTHRWEVSWADTVDSNLQVPTSKFGRLHLGQGDGGCLASVIIELAALRGDRHPGNGREVDNVSGFRESTYVCGRRQEGEKGKGGKVV